MTKDLKMVGLQYNITVTLFYIPYCLLEVPSNIILKMMRPSRWISILLFAWGLTMTYVDIPFQMKIIVTDLLSASWAWFPATRACLQPDGFSV